MNKSYWILTCRDAEDAASRRTEVLSAHVEYVKNCPLRILLAGPLFDGDASAGSLLILEDAPRADVDAFALRAPFRVAKVWSDVRIERFAPVISRIDS